MLVTLLLAPALGMVPPDTSASDARCIVAMVRLEEFADEADKADVRGSMLFYLGKLAARHDASQLGSLIAAAEPEVTDANLAALGTACGEDLSAVGSAVGV